MNTLVSRPNWTPVWEGSVGAPILILGENADSLTGKPFASSSFYELGKLLVESGISPGSCITAACFPASYQPDPKKSIREKNAEGFVHFRGVYVEPQLKEAAETLESLILLHQPTIIVAFDYFPLFLLLGLEGARKWRGSNLQLTLGDFTCKVIPTLSPEALFKEWELRGVVLRDLRRVGKEAFQGRVFKRPERHYILRPTFHQAYKFLHELLLEVNRATSPVKTEVDIETRAGHISTIGILRKPPVAISIPLMCVERPEGYWSAGEEFLLMKMMRQIMTHPNFGGVFQNGLYDQQYFERWYFFIPRMVWDTMVTHHAMFSWSKKGLDWLSSLYNEDHVYWKDDGKLWHPGMPEDDHWKYNADDLFNTRIVREGEEAAIAALTPTWEKLPQVVDFQNKITQTFLRMMLRGVRVNQEAKRELHLRSLQVIAETEAWLTSVIGHPLSIRSPKQMADFFYRELGLKERKKRQPNGFWSVTTDDNALEKIAESEPVLRKVIEAIQFIRSAGVFDSTFLQMPLDVDGRVRCSYNVAGTITYRLSSSENAFGSGGNLQNIPQGDGTGPRALPNIRRLFVPDPGMEWFDLDGDSADLRFVTWDSGCAQMKAYFAEGLKPYVEVAKEFFRDPTITKKHPSYPLFKAFCHATNYLGTPEGLSPRLGLPVHELYRMQKWYFGMCPEIKLWQDDICNQIRNRGWIENDFGYRCYFPGRITNNTLNEGVAWGPQSSVGRWINEIAWRLDQMYEQGISPIQLLLQVHDSLDGQYPIAERERSQILLLDAANFEIDTPSGPMKIPAGFKCSTKSWGDCE